jgi:hypothetical protein
MLHARVRRKVRKLLTFFAGYERYFVTNQRGFLKEDGFRALTTLSGELRAQVQKAQESS